LERIGSDDIAALSDQSARALLFLARSPYVGDRLAIVALLALATRAEIDDDLDESVISPARDASFVSDERHAAFRELDDAIVARKLSARAKP
jgi:hypothetical protein